MTKDVLKDFAVFKENNGLFVIRTLKQLYQKETATQVFSCESCEIFKDHLARITFAIGCFYQMLFRHEQSGFFGAYSFKIFISEPKCKNNLKNRDNFLCLYHKMSLGIMLSLPK